MPRSSKFTTVTPVLASYTWSDLAANTGNVELNLATEQLDGQAGTAETIQYYLTTSTPEVGYLKSAVGSRYSLIGNSASITFGITFNRPLTIQGDAHFMFTVQTSDAVTADLTGTATLKKGSTTIATETFRIPNNGYLHTKNVLLVVPKTTFGVSDELSLTVSATGTIPYPFLYHDPRDRNVGADTRGGGGFGNFGAISATTNPTKSTLTIPVLIQE